MHRFFFGILALLFLILLAISPNRSFAASGEEVFNTLRCDSCHKPDQKATAVPLTQIAKAYPDAEKLANFLKGESKPLIETERPGMMRGQLKKLEAVPDEEKKALADYILTFK